MNFSGAEDSSTGKYVDILSGNRVVTGSFTAEPTDIRLA